MNVSSTATATLTMPTYINYYIIIDVSQSMGIGSTATDMANLYIRSASVTPALTDGGCVFGCHVPRSSDGVHADKYSYEQVAHDASFGTPITLRLDAAMTAVQDMITQAQSSQTNSVAGGGAANLIKIGLYTMGGYATVASTTAWQGKPGAASTMFNTIASPSCYFSSSSPASCIPSPAPSMPLANMAATPASSPLSSTTPVVDLEDNSWAGYGDTYFSNSLTDFWQNVMSMTTNGTGLSASSPLNYVFIITDGVNDKYNSSSWWGHTVSALDTTLCTQMQAKATVGVIYTTYNPIYTNNNPAAGLQQQYIDGVAAIAWQIAPALQACASSSQYFYEATDGPAITTGMRQLMANSQLKARLTQ